MKILIIGFTKIKYMPYMKLYLDNIDCIANDVHLLYWNRDLNDEDTSSLENIKLHEFRCYQQDDIARFTKINSFIKYRIYAKKIIKQENYDFIFVLHSLTGVLIADILTKQYKEKYILDYRDSTYERFVPFRRIVGKLTKYSMATFVSSDAFRRFLPKNQENKIFTSHNLLLDSLNHRDEKEKYGTKSDKIRIVFWGFIRQEQINRTIIQKIAKDVRFELHYYGREQQTALNLKQYVNEINAKNVFFHGEYKPEDRYEFVRQTDIIHNIYYDNNSMMAMGNKYYDGIIFKIPQICMTGSYMGERCIKKGVGFKGDPFSDTFLDDVYRYYFNCKKNNDFIENCNIELKKIMKEYLASMNMIARIINNEK